jgi:hypothetical protein
MAKSSARDRKTPASRSEKGRKTSGQLKDADLDKAVGGVKSSGRTFTGDPCDGGE